MIIDLHAHYVPRSFLEAIEKEGAPYGASLRKDAADPTIMVGGRPYYRFDMGLLDPVAPVRALRPLARADREAILGGTAAKLLRLL